MYIYDISHHSMRGETGSISWGYIDGERKACGFHGVWEWIFRDNHHIDV